MTTSQPTASFLAEIADDLEPIPSEKLAYFRARLQSRLYNFVVSKFIEAERTRKFTKTQLARRINRSPAQITRWLSSPHNWEIETLSDLMLGICKAELDATELPLLNQSLRNSDAAPYWWHEINIQSSPTARGIMVPTPIGTTPQVSVRAA